MFPNGRFLTETSCHRLQKYGFRVDYSDDLWVYAVKDVHYILCRLVSELFGRNLVLLKMYTEANGMSRVDMLPVSSMFTTIKDGMNFINRMEEQEFKEFIKTQQKFFIPVFYEGSDV